MHPRPLRWAFSAMGRWRRPRRRCATRRPRLSIVSSSAASRRRCVGRAAVIGDRNYLPRSDGRRGRQMMSDQPPPTSNVLLTRTSWLIPAATNSLFETDEPGERTDGWASAANLKKSASIPATSTRSFHACAYRPSAVSPRTAAATPQRADLYCPVRLRILTRTSDWDQTKVLGSGKKNLLPNRDRLVFYKDGQDVLPAYRRCSRQDIQ